MIWKKPPSLEVFNNISANTMVAHLGIEFLDYGDDWISARMPVDERTRQPMGLLHGGASVALAETIGSMASALLIDDQQTSGVVGIEVNANHLKSVSEGFVTGTARPIRLGRRLHVWNIEIKHQDQLICISRLTVMLI